MSHVYKPVGWDRSKLVYDVALIAAAAAFIILFIRIAPGYDPAAGRVDVQVLRMRAFGLCAFLMLSTILCIGPLARLDARFLPLLYNRRHFGVLTAAVAAAHIWFVIQWYFNFSPTPKWEAMLSSNVSFGQALGFPFEIFGMAAFVILAVLALTSHDFWMSFLTPRVWKGVHMLIYAAYALVVAHVAFGYLQSTAEPVTPAIVVGAAVAVCVSHIVAGGRERGRDRAPRRVDGDWVAVGRWADIGEGRATVVALPAGERVAVFRYGGKFSAVTNVCAHQQGPLGEGRILDGCVTCPWHGHQFDPETGAAPAPFTDKIATYPLKRDGDMLFVHAVANPIGARTPAVVIEEAAA